MEYGCTGKYRGTLSRCPRIVLSGNGLHFCAKMANVVCNTYHTSFFTFATSPPAPHHPSGNGGRCESCQPHRIAQTNAAQKNDWGERILRVAVPNTSSISAATKLVPDKVHIMSRFPQLPLAVFEHTGVAGYQSLFCYQLARCELETVGQRRSYAIVRARHAPAVSRLDDYRNSGLFDVLRLLAC